MIIVHAITKCGFWQPCCSYATIDCPSAPLPKKMKLGKKLANCQCRGILAKASRLCIEPRMWGRESGRPVGGGGRSGSPLRARAFVPQRSPLPIAQLALVPLPFLRPPFLPCLPVRRTRALCPRRGKCGIPNECGTGKEESRFVPQVKS